MLRDHQDGDFRDDKFPNKTPFDWFLSKNFKMNLYEKEVHVQCFVIMQRPHKHLYALVFNQFFIVKEIFHWETNI